MMKKRTLGILCLTMVLAFVLAACGNGGSKSGDGAAAGTVSSPDDFAGHKIAVQVDTTSADLIDVLAAKDSSIEVQRYEKVTQCFDELALGRVDAVYVDSVVAAYYTSGSEEYTRSYLSDEPEPMAICLAKDAGALTAAVEAAIDTMYFDGTMADIALKNFGEDFTEGVRDVTEEPVIPTDFQTMKSGKLTVGSEIGYPPMEYTTDDGKEFIGFDIDVARKLGELLGLEVEFVNTSWDGIFAGLEKGQYDCIISSVSITPERDEKYTLTKPYVANRQCIVVKNG